MREEESRGEKDLHLSISLVILSSPFISLRFPPFLQLSPHPSLTLSPPCSFLMLSPLTPRGSLSSPAFSCCFIYSLFNSLRCICSPFLLISLSVPASFTISLRLIHSFSLHHHQPPSTSSSPSLFTHQLPAVSPSLV